MEAVGLYKPLDGTNQNLARRLAPLLLQQVFQTNRPAELDRDAFGFLPGTITTNRHWLYHQESQMTWQGRAHDQVTFVWFYPSDKSSRAGKGQSCQAVRITLNREGKPVIWEVLADSQPLRVLYVAGSLEHAALVEHQGRLPDRRFAIETAATAQSNVVVGRIVEDGPVVFGPIVYLEAGSRAVATLICRCMPSQAKTIADTRYYEVAPLPEDWQKRIAGWPDAREITRQLREFMARNLAADLRLPKEF